MHAHDESLLLVRIAVVKKACNRTTAHQLSKEYFSASTGNRVFRAQSTRYGPRMPTNRIMASRITIFRPVGFNKKFMANTPV
jgi:hypothetical protein